MRASCSVAALVAAYRAMPAEAQRSSLLLYILAVRALRLLMELPEGSGQGELALSPAQRLAAASKAAVKAAALVQQLSKSSEGSLRSTTALAAAAQRAAAACDVSAKASGADISSSAAAAAAAAAATEAAEAAQVALAALERAEAAIVKAADAAAAAESQAKLQHLSSQMRIAATPSSSPALLSRPIRTGTAVFRGAFDDISHSATPEDLQALHAVLQECLTALVRPVALGKGSGKLPMPERLAAVLLALTDLHTRLQRSVLDPKRQLRPVLDTAVRLTAVLSDEQFLAAAAKKRWPRMGEVSLLSPLLSAAATVSMSTITRVRNIDLVKQHSWSEEEWAGRRRELARALCISCTMLKEVEKAAPPQPRIPARAESSAAGSGAGQAAAGGGQLQAMLPSVNAGQSPAQAPLAGPGQAQAASRAVQDVKVLPRSDVVSPISSGKVQASVGQADSVDWPMQPWAAAATEQVLSPGQVISRLPMAPQQQAQPGKVAAGQAQGAVAKPGALETKAEQATAATTAVGQGRARPTSMQLAAAQAVPAAQVGAAAAAAPPGAGLPAAPAVEVVERRPAAASLAQVAEAQQAAAATTAVSV